MAVYAKPIATLISARMQTLIANISRTDSDIDKQKTALLPTTPSALGKKSGELWSTNSSAPLLAAILKAYVCLCVYVSVLCLAEQQYWHATIYIFVCLRLHVAAADIESTSIFLSAAMSAITGRSSMVGIAHRP